MELPKRVPDYMRLDIENVVTESEYNELEAYRELGSVKDIKESLEKATEKIIFVDNQNKTFRLFLTEMKDTILPKMHCNVEAHKLQLDWIKRVKEKL